MVEGISCQGIVLVLLGYRRAVNKAEAEHVYFSRGPRARLTLTHNRALELTPGSVRTKGYRSCTGSWPEVYSRYVF